MLMTKELHRDFRLAAWASSGELEAYIAQVAQADVQDMQALLAVLQDRRLVAEGRPHAVRCAAFGGLGDRFRHREMFLPYLRAIRTADPVLRRVLVEVAQRCNNPAVHPELVALFRDSDPAVRQAAGYLASTLGGNTVFSLLTELCGRPDFAGRVEAIEAMVVRAGYHAIPALDATLRAGTPDQKRLALQYLGDPELVSKNRSGALDAVSRPLEDPVESVRHEAISALSRIADEEEFIVRMGWRLDNLPVASVCAAMRAMSRYTSFRAIGLLRERFELGPRTVRLTVLEVLEMIATSDVLPVLADALNHKQTSVRMKAAEVLQNLSRTGQVDVARTILWLLRSRDLEIKRVAADVARGLDDTEGRLWPQLLRFLRDEDWWVRERISDALVDMAGTQLTRHVVLLLNDDSDVIRRYAVEMLMRLNDPFALGALVRSATEDVDWWVRERAVEAIGQLKDPRAIPYIADLMAREPELQLTAIQAFITIGDASALPMLAWLLVSSEEADVLLAALHALETLYDGREVPEVLPLVYHPDHAVRALAQGLAERWDMTFVAHVGFGSFSKSLSRLDQLLHTMNRSGGDDLILSAGRRPFIKRMGQMMPLTDEVLTNEEIEALLLPELTEAQLAMLDQLRDLDMSHEVKSEDLRFRANIFRAAGGLAAVFRVVKNEIRTLESLGLPDVVTRFGDLRNGLVLVGGPTGSGKSSTLAAIIDYINRSQPRHIVTLEDPIEVVHAPKLAMVNQREIGTHSRSFASALRATLRQDPDVILVGEMRDLTTIQFAITAAGTGHLVFGTVHTSSADTSVDRLINAFPAGQQLQVRSTLANSLRAVVCQNLIPRCDGPGRVLALEVMLNNDAVANLIRKGKTYQIPNIVATSRPAGMQSMDLELIRLCKSGVISPEDAYMRAVSKKDFEATMASTGGMGRSPNESPSGGDPQPPRPAVTSGSHPIRN
jgi:twitching motility protein PilT